MERPVRKENRLKDFDYNQSGAYFITICTQGRKHILCDVVGDGFPVPKDPGKIAEAHIQQIPVKFPGISVDTYVIMPDHIHMLLRVNDVGEAFRLPQDNKAGTNEGDFNGTGNPSPTIGNVIGWYKYQVTKQINLLAAASGVKVFQRSYYDHVIRNQADYNEIWEYIENNPQKWVVTHGDREDR